MIGKFVTRWCSCNGDHEERRWVLRLDYLRNKWRNGLQMGWEEEGEKCDDESLAGSPRQWGQPVCGSGINDYGGGGHACRKVIHTYHQNTDADVDAEAPC